MRTKKRTWSSRETGHLEALAKQENISYDAAQHSLFLAVIKTSPWS